MAETTRIRESKRMDKIVEEIDKIQEGKYLNELIKEAGEMRAEIKLLRSGNTLLRKERDDKREKEVYRGSVDELRYHHPAKGQVITREVALAGANEIEQLRANAPSNREESEGWLRAPIVTAVALALYGYNVSPLERARKMADHLEGADVQSMTEILCRSTAYAATELDPVAASVYVCHAMERYAGEALRRVKSNNMF